MRTHWRDAVNRPLTDDEFDDLLADATADMGSGDAIERLDVELKRLRAIEWRARREVARVWPPTTDDFAHGQGRGWNQAARHILDEPC